LEESLAQQIQVGPAKHLSFQHFQAVDMSLNGAVAPRERHPSLDRGIVVAQPLRKTLHSSKRACRRAGQPAIEAIGLTGAYDLGKIPCEGHGLCQVRMLRHELRELLFVRRVPRLRTPEHEPGSPPRGQLAVLWFYHDG